MVEIPKLVPSYAGFQLYAEVKNLTDILVSPVRPFIALIGGAKIESKRPVINKMLLLCDQILVGGKIALEWTEFVPNNLCLPKDYSYDKKDIGSQTIREYEEILSKSKTVVWAGPLGAYEDPNYILGTKKIAEAVIKSGAFSIIGGGDTVAAMKSLNLLDKFNFVSTGGSAMLDFLSGVSMPGIKVLN
jgi:phosphoglycerate kinase